MTHLSSIYHCSRVAGCDQSLDLSERFHDSVVAFKSFVSALSGVLDEMNKFYKKNCNNKK